MIDRETIQKFPEMRWIQVLSDLMKEAEANTEEKDETKKET